MSQFQVSPVNTSELLSGVIVSGVRELTELSHEVTVSQPQQDEMDFYVALEQSGMTPRSLERVIGAVDKFTELVRSGADLGSRELWAPNHVAVLERGDKVAPISVRGIGIIATASTGSLVALKNDSMHRAQRWEVNERQLLLFAGKGEVSAPEVDKRRLQKSKELGGRAIVITGSVKHF